MTSLSNKKFKEMNHKIGDRIDHVGQAGAKHFSIYYEKSEIVKGKSWSWRGTACSEDHRPNETYSFLKGPNGS